MDKFEYQKKIPEFLPGSSKNFYSVILYFWITVPFIIIERGTFVCKEPKTADRTFVKSSVFR